MNALSPIAPSTESSTAPAVQKPSAAKSWLKAIEMTARIEAEPERLLADIVDDWSLRTPNAPAVLSARESFSYAQFADRINRYARWAIEEKLAVGDTVCLMMPNRPEYLAAWLGITRVGGVVALINTQLKGSSLAHCINVAQSSHIIVDNDLAEALAGAFPHIDPATKVWSHGGEKSHERIDLAIDR